MKTEKPVQFGIIGVGRIVRNVFAAALAEADNAELAAAASRDITRAEAINPRRTYDNYIALLDDPEVEAVYIATHNGLHHELAIAAFERRKHVLCEKSLACNPQQCKEMIAAAEEYNCHLVEAFMYRYHPCMLKAKALIDEGALGELKSVQASFNILLDDVNDVRYQESWGGGSALDVGCYCVNACRYLFGSMPLAVTAMGNFHPTHKVDIALHGIMDFGNDRHGVISSGFDGGVYNQIIAYGKTGRLTLPYGFDTNSKPVPMLLDTPAGRQEITFDPVNVYKLEIEDLARAVRGGDTPMFPPEEGLHNALVIEALLTSAREGGRRISLDS